MLGVVPQAHADPTTDTDGTVCLPGPNDCQYIAALHRDGIDTAPPDADVYQVGHDICRALRTRTEPDVVARIHSDSPAIPTWWLSTVVRDAHQYLCPDAGKVNT
jgi:hypothetical protein